METVDLKLDESNELEFKLEIEAAEQVSPPKARLMCECKGLSYAFDGEITNEGEIKVVVPSMKGRLTEGKHKAQLEVFIDNKYFVPLEFEANFKESVKVVAEIRTRTSKPTQSVKAAIVSKKPVVNEDEDRAKAKKALQEAAQKKRRAKELLEKKRLLEEKKLELKRKRAEAAKRKRLLEQKKKRKSKSPDVELRDLLGDLGITDDD